jgi:Tfp pilus assembly protein FimT
MTHRATPRSGFTIVELLVVTSIMLLMFGLVLSGARPGAGGQVRQTGQSLASLLTSAQSQSLGSPAGAGLVIQSGTASGLAATIATVVAMADVPPLLTGTTGTAGFPPTRENGVLPQVTNVTLTPFNGDADELQHGYKIRFGGAVATGTTYPYQPPSAWMALAATAASGSPTCTGVVSFRWGAGQSGTNSVWPEPTKNGSGGLNPLDFQVARYPVAGKSLLEMPKSTAIDLRYSGIGEDNATIWNQATWIASGTSASGWGTLAGKGSLAVLFDSVGGVDAVMQNVEGPSSVRSLAPVDPVEPLYLLVTARTEIEDPSFMPLSSPRAIWVVIHPQTGRVTTALNVPQTGVDALALRAARARARAGAMVGK